jgi:hypothetical protein
MTKFEDLRRKAVTSAAGAAVLGGAEVVGITQGHHALAFVFLGMQVVLIVMAIVLLARMKSAGSDSR